MYLLDTNVISEARKGQRMNAGVRDFLLVADPVSLYLPVQVVGELRQGIARLQQRGDAAQAGLLARWLEMLLSDYANRVLSFGSDAAQAWGQLMSAGSGPVVDRQIAAIALFHDLVVVTRNARDFQATGVRLLNPFLE